MDIRKHIVKIFEQLCKEKKNIIAIDVSTQGLFKYITNPNEFAGPIVEAWAHVHFPKFFNEYKAATAGGQAFQDAKAKLENQEVLLNLKAKAKEKEKRSRINLSSFDRFSKHYGKEDCLPYYVIVFKYTWETEPSTLRIDVQKVLYCFDLLEIPKENYKIEGSSEGSFRVFIAPVPEIAHTDYKGKITKVSPSEFVKLINELKINYLRKKKEKRDKLISQTKLV